MSRICIYPQEPDYESLVLFPGNTLFLKKIIKTDKTNYLNIANGLRTLFSVSTVYTPAEMATKIATITAYDGSYT